MTLNKDIMSYFNEYIYMVMVVIEVFGGPPYNFGHPKHF